MGATRALITGIGGQDGSYLAELLLSKGYEVHGVLRSSVDGKSGSAGRFRYDPSLYGERLFFHNADLVDGESMKLLIREIEPDEIFNLASMSSVRESFVEPYRTCDVNGMGALRLLEAVRLSGLPIRLFQASSSEIFGRTLQLECDEASPICPVSPYGCSKAYAHFLVQTYRQGYGIFACNGILFNHESPRRGEGFVTSKISRGLARIKAGLDDCLVLGNLDARRDWGYAEDYVDCMWRMLQEQYADDYVIATGELHSVREFVQETARYFNISIRWEGEGSNEIGIDEATGRGIIKIDESKYRPVDVNYFSGNASKAEKVLGWCPTKKFSELVWLMAASEADCITNFNGSTR